MTLARRGFLAAISAALLAPFQADERQEFYAKVGPTDHGASGGVGEHLSDKGSLILTVMPSVVSIGIDGDLSGLFEGDYIRFRIVPAENHLTDVVWKGRHIHVRNVELTP